MGGDRLRILRFAVGTPDGPCSSAWNVFAHRGHVYVTPPGTLGGVIKFSFHEKGVCRYAFTREHGKLPALPDRAIRKWRREPTPPPGSGLGRLVLLLLFPTDYLSTTHHATGRSLVWVDPAPAGGALGIEFFYTQEPREQVEALFAVRGERQLLAYAMLPTGEAFAIARAPGDWENKDGVFETDGVAVVGCSSQDPTGRPLRVHYPLKATAQDGAMVMLELGGHALPIGSEVRPLPSAVASSRGPVA